VNILIIGGGAMGGSMALRLFSCDHEVAVFEREKQTNNMLRDRGIKTGNSLEELLFSRDVVILAVPMNVEEAILEELNFSSTVMDVASVMTPFQKIARRRMLRFVSGHPMAGNEFAGSAGWDVHIFENRPFLLSPSPFANQDDIDTVIEITNCLGSRPKIVEPLSHDRMLSRISQSIYYLSRAAIVLGRGFEEYTGPGFASTTRLGKQNQEMVVDMARYNGSNIVESLKEAESYLREVRMAIESGDLEELNKIIQR